MNDWKKEKNHQNDNNYKNEKNKQNENHLHYDLDKNFQNKHDSKSDNLSAKNQMFEKSIFL